MAKDKKTIELEVKVKTNELTSAMKESQQEVSNTISSVKELEKEIGSLNGELTKKEVKEYAARTAKYQAKEIYERLKAEEKADKETLKQMEAEYKAEENLRAKQEAARKAEAEAAKQAEIKREQERAAAIRRGKEAVARTNEQYHREEMTRLKTRLNEEDRVAKQQEQILRRQAERVAMFRAKYSTGANISASAYVKSSMQEQRDIASLRELGYTGQIQQAYTSIPYEKYVAHQKQLTEQARKYTEALKSSKNALSQQQVAYTKMIAQVAVLEETWQNIKRAAMVMRMVYGQISDELYDMEKNMSKVKQNLELSDTYKGQDGVKALTNDLKRFQEASILFGIAYGEKVSDVSESFSILSRRFKDTDTLMYIENLAIQIARLDNIDLKTVSTDLESIILQLGLSAEQTKEFVNYSAIAVHSSRITGQELLAALKRSGSAFKATKADLKETIALISTLSTTTGREGGTIGNVFRGFLSYEMKDSKKIEGAFKKLGVQRYLKDVVEATDEADGVTRQYFRNQGALISEMMKNYKGLDDAEKSAVVSALAGGVYRVNEIRTLFEEGSEVYQDLMDKLNKASDEKTRELMETSLLNYSTMVERLKSSMQGLEVVIGEALLPTLNEFCMLITHACIYVLKNRDAVEELIKQAIAVGQVILAAGGSFIAFKFGALYMNVCVGACELLGMTMKETAIATEAEAVATKEAATTAGEAAVAIEGEVIANEANTQAANTATTATLSEAAATEKQAIEAGKATASTTALAGANERASITSKQAAVSSGIFASGLGKIAAQAAMVASQVFVATMAVAALTVAYRAWREQCTEEGRAEVDEARYRSLKKRKEIIENNLEATADMDENSFGDADIEWLRDNNLSTVWTSQDEELLKETEGRVNQRKEKKKKEALEELNELIQTIGVDKFNAAEFPNTPIPPIPSTAVPSEEEDDGKGGRGSKGGRGRGQRNPVSAWEKDTYKESKYRRQIETEKYESTKKSIELERKYKGDGAVSAKEIENELEKYHNLKRTMQEAQSLYDKNTASIDKFVTGNEEIQAVLEEQKVAWSELSAEEKKDIAERTKDKTFKRLVQEQDEVRKSVQSSIDAFKEQKYVVEQLGGFLNAYEQQDRNIKVADLDYDLAMSELDFNTSSVVAIHEQRYQAELKHLQAKNNAIQEKIRLKQEELYNTRKSMRDLEQQIKENADENNEDLAMDYEKSSKAVRKLEDELKSLKTEGNKVGQELKNKADEVNMVLREKGASTFADLIVEGKSFKDIWKGLWNDIAKTAINALFKVQTNNWVTSLIGGLGGGGGKAAASSSSSSFGWTGSILTSVFGAANGGSIPGYANGGQYIQGAGTGKSDSILAYLANKDRFVYLSNGEYVMTAEATKRIGVNNLDRMNYADGGALNPVPYVPTINPVIAKTATTTLYPRSRTEELLTEQNKQMAEQLGLMKNMGQGGDGKMVILNTQASSADVIKAIQDNPRAIQALLGRQSRKGFR